MLKRSWTAVWRIGAFALLWGILIAPTALIVRGSPPAPGGGLRPDTRLWVELVALVTIVLAAWVMVRFVDRRPFRTLGLSPGTAPRDVALGVGIGTLLVLVSLGALWVPGWIVTSPPAGFSWGALGLMGGVMLANAATQEVLARGYVLQTLETQFDALVAVIGSSALFVLLHAGALVEGGVVPGINLLAAGVLLGLAYLTTRTLWLPIGLHFAWNFLQGPVLGIPVTGQELDAGWTMVRLDGPALLTGGEFGLEAGLASTAVIVGAIVALLAWRPGALSMQGGRQLGESTG